PAAARRDPGIVVPFHSAWRMSIIAAGGLAVLLGASMLSPRGVRRVAFATFVLAILVMAALPFIGHEAKGAARWLPLGPFRLQPSEFVKPALIVLAAWMFAEGQKGEGVPGVSIAFGLYALTVGLLVVQPDIGQTILVTAAFMAVFFMAGVPFRWMLGLAGLAAAGLVAIYFSLSHFQARIHAFLGGEDADTFQIDRASEAIAAGGLV